MSDLDDKLWTILEKAQSCIDDEQVKAEVAYVAIAQIKQAFADEGYINTKRVTLKSFTVNDLMTGQEWYSRFANEFRGTPAGTMITLNVDEIMEAARRATCLGSEE